MECSANYVIKKENVHIFDYTWQIIANPNALSNSCFKHWEEIAAKLDELQLDYQFYISDETASGRKLASNLCKKGHRHIIAIGGDGTLNSILNGIFDSGVPTEEVYVAVLPLGTGNDWCRTHNYPRPHMESINIFFRGQFVKHDVGLVECIKDGKIIDKNYFINIAGFAFDAAIIRKTEKNKARFNNRYVYILNLLKVFLSYKAQKIRIRYSDKSIEDDIFSIAVGNCRYNGNGMQQCPKANPVDGLFNTLILKKITPLKILKNLGNLYNGKLGNVPEISYINTDELFIEANPHIDCETEGDTITLADYHIKMIPHSINMLTGL